DNVIHTITLFWLLHSATGCGARPNVAEKDDYLVDMLVDLGFVTAPQVQALRAEANAAGVGTVDLMLANKIIRPADVTQAKAAHFGAEVVNLSEINIADDVIATVPRHIAKKYRVVPVFKHGNALTIALADPSDLDTIDSLNHLLRMEIVHQVASEADIEAALSKYYGGDKKSLEEDSRFSEVIKTLTEEHVQAVNDEGVTVEADAP